MAEKQQVNRMHLANIVEEKDDGSHRESLWFGGSPENLSLMIQDVMSDWFKPNAATLDKKIIKYHQMLEDKEHLSFPKLSGEAFHADGIRLRVDVTNDVNEMFGFVVNEICGIFAKAGERPEQFPSFAAFRQHFLHAYDIDQEFKDLLNGPNEITISKSLYLIDMKYDYAGRHTAGAAK